MITIEALQYCWSCCCCRIPQAHKAWLGCCLSWKGENLAYAATCGLEEGGLQKTSAVLLLELHITSNTQSTAGPVWVTLIKSLFLMLIFLNLCLSFPSLLQRNPRKVRSYWQSGFFFFFLFWSWLSFCCVVRAVFPNSWIRVLGVFQTLWSP